MRMSSKSIVAVVGMAMGAMACSGKTAVTPVTLGAIFSQTGSIAVVGPGQLLAVQQALSEINDAGGVLGAPLVVNIQDDQSTADGGFAAATLLVKAGVPAIIGGDSDSSMQAILSVTVPANVITISDVASSTTIANPATDNGTVFATAADKVVEGTILAERAFTAHGFKKAAILQVALGVPQATASGFNTKFTNLGGMITDNITITSGLSSYASVLTQVYADGPPDCILLATYTPDAIQVIADYNANFSSKNTTWLFLPTVNNPNFFTGVGSSQFPPNNEGIDTGSGPGFTAFDTAFKALFPTQDPGIEEPGTYDDVYTLALAIQAGGKADSQTIKTNLRTVADPPGLAVGPGDWAKALAALQSGKKINYEGAGSACDFDQNGEAVAPYLIWSYTGGQEVTLVPAITP